jgi:DNA-binding NtrC family response regulator
LPSIPANKPTVFIADDDATTRSLLRLMLRADGYDVIGETGNGDKALEACERMRPEVLLLDINMPGMDGLKVLEKIRQSQPGMKVVMISGDATLESVQGALAKGASGFVVKPFNTSTVLRDIEAALESK